MEQWTYLAHPDSPSLRMCGAATPRAGTAYRFGTITDIKLKCAVDAGSAYVILPNNECARKTLHQAREVQQLQVVGQETQSLDSCHL